MSMDLAVKTYRYDPHHFEAGTGPVAKAVKEAAADIPPWREELFLRSIFLCWGKICIQRFRMRS